jgi:hypothetical protein
MKFYLLTYHGNLLSCPTGQSELAQVKFEDSGSRNELVSVELEPHQARQVYADFIAGETGGIIEASISHLGKRNIHIDAQARTVSIEHGGRFLTTQPDGLVAQDRDRAAAWERLLPCTDDDLDLLQTLKGSDWIIKSTRALISGKDIRLTEDFTLQLGETRIPLAYNLPLDRRNFPFRLVVLLEGWRIDELILFKPMIFYLAFGRENVFQQLNLSLESLARVGRYRGKVLLFTDREHNQICQDNPWLDPAQLEIGCIPAQDWVGYVAGKYCILEEERAYSYQPVVYMDPDIIYNTDTKSFLIEMAVSERITAAIETFSGLEHAPSVGATLLQMDHQQPRFACGFNCGTIGVPNLPGHKHTLELIRRIISNFLSIRGRSAFLWVDQEAANYVSYKIGHFDTNQISKCVRYGFETATTPLAPLSGLVHFWGVGRVSRPDIMRDYLDRVLDHYERLEPQPDRRLAMDNTALAPPVPPPSNQLPDGPV